MPSILQNFLFVLKRFKTSSVLIIVGLSVALAVFTVSFLQAEYDFSYDRGFKKHNDIYQLWMKIGSTNMEIPVITDFIANDMARDFAEVKSYCLTTYSEKDRPKQTFFLPDDTKEYESHYVEATAGLLDVFLPEIIEGDVSPIFEAPGRAMIPQSWAKTIFGSEDPIGKVLIRKGHDQQLVITAIYKDFPERSTLLNGIYTYLPDRGDSSNSFNLNFYGFFEIDKQNVDTLTAKINNNWLEGFIGTWITDMRFVPLKEIHYEYDKGSRNTTLSLLAIGIVILIISYINFINFAVALAPARVRELNIRKILGERDSKLRFVVASEAALFSLVSYILSLLIIYSVSRSFISDFLAVDLTLTNHVPLLTLLAVIVAGVGFLIGLYPAVYTTKFQPATVLNGKFALSGKGTGLRNTLITIQFFASITLIIVSLLIKMQHDFIHKESWKFERDNIVYVTTNKDMQYEAFMGELDSSPIITDYTYSAFLPSTVGQYNGGEYKDKTITIALWTVAPNFMDFFGVPLWEGNSFSDDDSRQLIINKKALEAYELEEIIGDSLLGAKVIGIIEDITFQPLERAIDPMGFYKGSPEDALGFFLIKINSNNIPQAFDFIEQAWKKTHTGDYDIHFLDDSFDRLYKKQNDLAKLITLFGGIALLIALMGVYGIILFNAKYKAKEIAIRKVNGSSTEEIILMLNQTILIQLAIAFVVALPVAYYTISKWLESFAYKTAIHWWLFPLGGLIVLLITVITVSWQSYRSATANPTKALNN